MLIYADKLHCLHRAEYKTLPIARIKEQHFCLELSDENILWECCNTETLETSRLHNAVDNVRTKKWETLDIARRRKNILLYAAE